MKQITTAALEHLLLAHPKAHVFERNGKTIVSVPMYDIDRDEAWNEEREVIDGPQETNHGILPVFNVRTGPKFNPDGDVKQSPLGHFYKIIGYTPGKKDDKKQDG